VAALHNEVWLRTHDVWLRYSAPMKHPRWTRRQFVHAGLGATGALALGACRHDGALRGASAIEPAADLDELARRVRGRLLRSGSSGYDDARKVWNLAYDRHPLAMARCADVDDVRRCVEFARKHGIPVAIRGGAHSYAGFGVADGALQVDLASFNAVTVDADRRLASVGGGARIKELLAATLPLGLLAPMGACGDVGVAGLALAGGDTAARGLFGTACDNVVGAQIVTSDGEVLELGPGRNEDLFWAIRGGGGNFGIVTRLDLRLHDVRPYSSATFEFGWNEVAGVMRTFGELVRETPDEVRAGFFVDPVAGASASCGFYGDAAAAAGYLAKWKVAFRRVEPVMRNPKPNPQGEVWTTTSVAVDGAFLEGMTGDVVDVLARAAVAGRGIGAMLMGLSNGVASRVGMTEMRTRCGARD
jgi:FAD/FMN-containing dehydrogenase